MNMEFVLKAQFFLSLLIIVSGSKFAKVKQTESDNPLITTSLGKIEGSLLTSRLGKKIYSFRGIRYAKSPTGTLRFQPPEPVEAWTGVYNATVDGPACPQPTYDIFEISEDCLMLNVYSTKLPTNTENPKRPVIVHFHAGGWYSVTGQSVWAGPQYLMDKDIVLVTLNYRLGSLGFISTGDKFAPGNNGLKDQVMALKWIKNNIFSFGGDPDLVTITGYSAGGMSVILHMISPMSKGLFHRAISMSGAPTAQWQIGSDQKHLAIKQAEILDCPDTSSSREIFKCLETKTFQDIGGSLGNFSEFGFDPVLKWTPVIEPDFGQERFLTDDPTVLIQQGKYSKMPLMTGVTSLEFANIAYTVTENETLLNQMNQEFERIAPISFLYERNTSRSKLISAELKKFYFKNDKINKSHVEQLGQLYADSLIGFGVHRLAQLTAKNNDYPVYYYRFSYKGMYSHFYLPGRNDSVPIGPVHHDDLIYLFYISTLFPLFNDNDPSTKIVERLTTLWYNFAKTGNPTPDKNPILERTIWEPLTPINQKFLDIKCHLDMKQMMFNDRYSLWDRLFPLPNV